MLNHAPYSIASFCVCKNTLSEADANVGVDEITTVWTRRAAYVPSTGKATPLGCVSLTKLRVPGSVPSATTLSLSILVAALTILSTGKESKAKKAVSFC